MTKRVRGSIVKTDFLFKGLTSSKD